ncbi:hypothetical protein LRP30_31875 [Bradyrhizobium sp. C-145]|uniref:hypothetical protein n=1 Tax=Bradyrhizobium sp. C-145 TaxID=574727 RepID=UPI00201B76DF|nr:hypothetical protein [Bradyrhizobium sp. C-145]UQR61463.1 hypothetical protein LRP30_31875 [Bradyrhizobium sp. C-145]
MAKGHCGLVETAIAAWIAFYSTRRRSSGGSIIARPVDMMLCLNNAEGLPTCSQAQQQQQTALFAA